MLTKSPNVKENEKLILDPRLNPDRYQKLSILEGHPLPMLTIFGRHQLMRS